ncbi:MAG TPA: hypothetical protein VFJ76_06735 [Solirubrobacterales bacterium]|nr:hypothetical protein [Solirubrobacterales bacterium]
MRLRRAGALLLVLVASMVAGAIVGCGSGGGGDTAEGLPASPDGKAEAANFEGVHSGLIELALEIDRYKKKPEEINMRVLGKFMKVGEEPLPQFDFAIESNGDLAGHQVAFLSGPLFRAEKWVFNFEKQVYEPDHAAFEELKSKFEAAQEEEGGEGNATACVEAAEGFDVTDVVHHVSFEGKGETLDGKKVETVGADIDASAAIDELIKLTEKSPGCKAQLEAVGLPPAAELKELEQELKGNLTAARLTLSLDKNGLARYFKILANVELPRNEELEVELVMRLSEVNQVTELPISSGSRPYPAILRQFGLDEGDVKQADAGEIYLGVLGVLADRLFGREQG